MYRHATRIDGGLSVPYDVVKVISFKTIVVAHADSPPIPIRMKIYEKINLRLYGHKEMLFRLVVKK
jgi:hypothetical protein